MTADAPARSGHLDRVLPGARSGRDIVPGEPAQVADLAEQLETLARGLGTVHRMLTGVWTTGWRGAAANVFRHLMQSFPQPYARSATVIAGAAGAVRAHAAVLAAAQRSGDEAVQLDLRAATLRQTSGPPSAGIVPPAIAIAMQRRAVVLAEQARAQVRASAAEAAAALRAGADAAPHEPGRLGRLLDRVLDLQREVRTGVVESSLATLTAVALYGPDRMVRDPDGWWRDVSAMGAATADLAKDPARMAAVLVDWDTLKDNRGRWLGHLAPDLALGAATGGGGLVANRGASAGVRAATVVTHGQLRADVRTAVQTSQATARSRLRLRDLRPYTSRPNEYGHVARLTPAQRLATAALARDARWAADDVTARVQLAAEAVGVHREGHGHRVKGRDSLYRKVSALAAEPGASIETVLPRVNDTLRYTIVVPAKGYVSSAAGAVTALQAQRMVLVHAKSFWGRERYQGLNLTMADARTGRLLEVQVHTPQSWQATVDTHADYERFRQVGIPPAEKAMYKQRIGLVYATVPPPDGVAQLQEALRVDPDIKAGNSPPGLLSLDLRAPAAAAMGSAGVSSLVSQYDVRRREHEDRHPR